MRILVVDDDTDIRQLAALALSVDDATVVSASGIEEAVRLLNGSHWDVVVSDLRMPGIDGIEAQYAGASVLEHARRLHPDARLVLWSAYIDTKDEHLAASIRDTGATVIQKPATPAIFRQIVLGP